MALRNVSLSIAINKTTWIVGKSGSGKSSIGSLILKAYTAQGGLITLDDYPLDSLDTNWLRENITLVQQNSVLFDDTIFQNIALGKGKSEVTSQQAIEALFMAGGEDLLADTESISCRMVGVKGGSLSSGQKQRVCKGAVIICSRTNSEYSRLSLLEQSYGIHHSSSLMKPLVHLTALLG